MNVRRIVLRMMRKKSDKGGKIIKYTEGEIEQREEKVMKMEKEIM